MPTPGVFLTAGGIGRGASGALDRQIDALSHMRGAPFLEAAVQGCHQLLGSLPSEARAVHIGVMHGRDPGTIRLCLSHITGTGLLRYLTAIGWQGIISDVRDVMDGLRCSSVPDPLGSVTLVHVDMHHGLGPRLGLELPFRADVQLTGGIVETDLLDRVSALGLGASSKCAAAMGWPRRARIWLDHRQSMTPLVCRLSNLKFVWNGSRDPEVKVYLSAFHGSDAERRPFPPPAL
jgi:hypothetical protein